MKISVQLPAQKENEWRRLVACFDGVEELAISAVDLLWRKYRADVLKHEKQKAYQSNKIVSVKARLSNLRCNKRKSIAHNYWTLVGAYPRIISKDGYVSLPKAWIDCFGEIDGVWLCANETEKSVALLSDSDADEALRNGKNVIPVTIDSKNRIRFDREFQKIIGSERCIVLQGRFRYAVVSSAKMYSSCTISNNEGLKR